MPFPDLQNDSLNRLAKKLLFIGLCFHLLSAWFNAGYYHPDEYFQIFEFASYKIGKTPAQDLAWEYGHAVRPAMQPFMVYAFSGIFHLSNPVAISFLARLISSVPAW